jgi:hypothetical protein
MPSPRAKRSERCTHSSAPAVIAASFAAVSPAPRLPLNADAASSLYSATTSRPSASAAARQSASYVGIDPRSSAVDLAA